jgi:hypothetical protein
MIVVCIRASEISKDNECAVFSCLPETCDELAMPHLLLCQEIQCGFARDRSARELSDFVSKDVNMLILPTSKRLSSYVIVAKGQYIFLSNVTLRPGVK